MVKHGNDAGAPLIFHADAARGIERRVELPIRVNSIVYGSESSVG